MHEQRLLPKSKADVLQNVGQGDVFGLERLPLLLELMRQTDPPALIGYTDSSVLGHILAHELCSGSLTPLRTGHFCWRIPVKMMQEYPCFLEKLMISVVERVLMKVVTICEKIIGLSQLGNGIISGRPLINQDKLVF